MNKLMMAAAIAAMAFGAKAADGSWGEVQKAGDEGRAAYDYTYTLALTVSPNVKDVNPLETRGHQAVYLMSKDHQTIYACADYSELVHWRKETQKDDQINHPEGKPGGSAAIEFKDADNMAHALITASSSNPEQPNSEKWVMSLTFGSDTKLTDNAFGGTTPVENSQGGYDNVFNDIVLYVVHENEAYTFETPVTWTMSGTDTYGLTASYGYPVNTPEPTSAMLLLLGVAGLALKRKRA